MKTSVALLLATIGSASAFAPISSSRQTLRLQSESTAPAEPEVPKVTPINGWVPDKSLPLYGLPGAIGPLGFFDPLGFASEKELTGAKRLREAEVMHGRVSMMAFIGYLIAENTPTIAYGFEHPTIANDMIPTVPITVMFPFFLAINIAEALRANKGWVEPGLGALFTLRESYYPGDLGTYLDAINHRLRNVSRTIGLTTKFFSSFSCCYCWLLRFVCRRW